MDGIDITIGLLLAYSGRRGYRRGLLPTLASLVAPVAGFIAATHWGNQVWLELTRYIDAPDGFLRFIAYPLTFLVVAGGLRVSAAVLGSVLGLGESLLLNALGSLAAIFTTAMVLGAMVVLLSSIAPPPGDSVKSHTAGSKLLTKRSRGIIASLDQRLRKSVLAPPLANMAETVIGVVYQDSEQTTGTTGVAGPGKD